MWIKISESIQIGDFMEKSRLYEMNRIAARIYYNNLLQGKDSRGRDYFKERELKPETITHYGLGYAPDSWNFMTNALIKQGFSINEIIEGGLAAKNDSGKVYDFFRNRVMFPVIDTQGEVIGFGGRVLDDSKPKYLNTPATAVFDKGENLFSMNFAKNSKMDKLVLGEGYMDVIAMNQSGFDGAIATLGTAITENQARFISRHTDNVIVSYDSDEAGQSATKKAIKLLSENGVKVSVLHIEGAKDPDEYIKKFGADKFDRLLRKAESAISWTLNRAEKELELTLDADKRELASRLSAPLSVLTPAEQTIQAAYIEQKYGVKVKPEREEVFSMPEIVRRNVHEEVTPKEVYDRAAEVNDMPPDLSIEDLELPTDIIDCLGQSGISTLGDVLSLSPKDMSTIFDGDKAMVNELCDFCGIKEESREIE